MASVPRNLWLPSLRRRQELLSSALACVQNVLRHCMQTKPDSMLLHSYVVSWAVVLGSFPVKRQLCFDFPRSKTCSSPLIWVLYGLQDVPEVATVIRTIKLTLKQKNLLPSDVLEIEKNKIRGSTAYSTSAANNLDQGSQLLLTLQKNKFKKVKLLLT